MPSRRSTVFVLAFVALVSAGVPSRAEEGAGRRELVQGREAAARQDHAAAARHFRAALSSFDPLKDREALADTWLELGLTSLNGLGDPEAALTAFLTSAALAQEPSTAWLWASVAAEKLERTEEAVTYKTRALERPVPAPAPTPAPEPDPEPVVQEAAPEKPDAVQHFFGPEAAEKKPAPKQEQARKESPPQEPAPAEAEKPKEAVDAVQYFFGEKEPEAEEKPPGER